MDGLTTIYPGPFIDESIPAEECTGMGQPFWNHLALGHYCGTSEQLSFSFWTHLDVTLFRLCKLIRKVIISRDDFLFGVAQADLLDHIL